MTTWQETVEIRRKEDKFWEWPAFQESETDVPMESLDHRGKSMLAHPPLLSLTSGFGVSRPKVISLSLFLCSLDQFGF